MAHPIRKSFSFLLLLAVLLVGCAGPGGPVEAPTETAAPSAPSATPPVETPATPAAVELARQALAGKLGTDSSPIQLEAFAPSEWADACLGVPVQDEQCAQVVTPGYRGIFVAQGNRYAFHSDLQGVNVRFLPAGALEAQDALAYQLGLETVAVQVVAVEGVVWSDGCLGVYQPDRNCTAVEVPGYRLQLEAGGQSYEYHTDERGSEVLRVDVTPGDLGKVLVSWSRRHESGCDSAQISATRVAYGPCDGGLTTAEISPARGEGVLYLADKFAPFEAEFGAGTVSFSGSGPVTATPTQQRMIVEWANLVYQEASTGDGSEDRGLVFTWQREGGFAGFCDEVKAYLSGEAIASACQQPQIGQFWLSDSRMRSVFAWVDELASFETEKTDPAKTDALTLRIAFQGAGTRQASDDEIQAMFDLAGELAARNLVVPDARAIEQARQALEGYLLALAVGNYAGAASAYGGDFEVLINNNPDISPQDGAALFEAGCTYNGFVCSLSILNVVDLVQLSAVDFRVTVELKNPDGSLFSLGPCCGATEEEMPPVTQFDFRVSNPGGEYRVMDLPVYVP